MSNGKILDKPVDDRLRWIVTASTQKLEDSSSAPSGPVNHHDDCEQQQLSNWRRVGKQPPKTRCFPQISHIKGIRAKAAPHAAIKISVIALCPSVRIQVLQQRKMKNREPTLSMEERVSGLKTQQDQFSQTPNRPWKQRTTLTHPNHQRVVFEQSAFVASFRTFERNMKLQQNTSEISGTV